MHTIWARFHPTWKIGINLFDIFLYLLFIFQKACKVVKIHDFLLVAVGDHYQIEVSASGNHLVERAEFFKAQRALVLICVCILQITTKVSYEQEITLAVCVWLEITTPPKKICPILPSEGRILHHQTWWSSVTETIGIRRGGQWATELKRNCSATKAICSAVAIWPSCGTLLPTYCIYIFVYCLHAFVCLLLWLRWWEDYIHFIPLKGKGR